MCLKYLYSCMLHHLNNSTFSIQYFQKGAYGKYSNPPLRLNKVYSHFNKLSSSPETLVGCLLDETLRVSEPNICIQEKNKKKDENKVDYVFHRRERRTMKRIRFCQILFQGNVRSKIIIMHEIIANSRPRWNKNE